MWWRAFVYRKSWTADCEMTRLGGPAKGIDAASDGGQTGMGLQEAIDNHQQAATRVVQDAAVRLAAAVDAGVTSVMDFRRAWIRDLGRLARTHQADWVISAYAVQIIRQLRGQLPIS
jgi:hypothetical protein